MDGRIEEVGCLIPKAWIDYLNEQILLKNEELNIIDATENNGIVDIPVIKRTARTRRTVAKLTLGITSNTIVPNGKLINAFSSPKGKKHFPLTNETYDWIRNGWIIREYRLEKDERTVKSEQYRMGYGLFQVQLEVKQQKKNENKKLMIEWSNQWNDLKNISNVTDSQRVDSLMVFADKLEAIADEGHQFAEDRIEQLETVNGTWRFRKQLLFCHFLLALYQISVVEHHFDWKQIGARYYKKIGGSKEFDSYKNDFIEEAERLLGRPLHLFGLTSLGTITPIFFTGPMQGEKVIYNYGSVHATTDLAVFTDHFQTNAEVLWLVENRGVLTRMAYEEQFLLDSKSYVLGIDGQLRSAHRQLIKSLVPFVKQVIIWTDVDEAGLAIAKDVASVTHNVQVVTKWVVPPLEVVTNMEQFEAHYQQSMQAGKEEQEQEIGGVKQWEKWINH